MAEDQLESEVISKSGDPLQKSDEIRQTVADVYTFVRSREINKTIGSFTFDHYIDEAKRQIKGSGRALRDASGSDQLSLGTRPTQLESLSKLRESFDKTFEDAKKLAEKADKGSDS